jgi:polyisoprenoid-binding protein YceI
VNPLQKQTAIGLAAAVLIVVAGAAGAYAYFFSGLRTSPKPLALSSPAAASAPAASAAPAGSGLSGRWTVSQGSQVGYRVKEQFVGETSTHEAVARTSGVTGGFTVQQDSSGWVASTIRFSAQLGGLQSVDQVLGRNVSQRDFLVSRTLAVQQYPDATFQALSVTVPATLESGGTVEVTVPGQLTIHGTTRNADATVRLRLVGGQVQAAGSTAVTMTDFGITPPQVPFTTSDSHVTIEFQLVLVKGS